MSASADAEIEEMKRRSKDIWLKAEAHGNRYLLPRRSRPPQPGMPKSELDKEYDACGWLVSEGYASWIDSISHFSPGIETHPGGREWR